jgi:phosphoesterase RecJ-like protein
MATAVYAEIIYTTNCFLNNSCNGTIFALANELILLGANHQDIKNSLIVSKPLCYLRLKSIMLKDMLLKNNATLAQFFITQEILKTTGATLNMAKEITQEARQLKYIKNIELVDLDIKKRIFYE